MLKIIVDQNVLCGIFVLQRSGNMACVCFSYSLYFKWCYVSISQGNQPHCTGKLVVVVITRLISSNFLWVRHVAADCLHHLCEMCTVGFILYWKHAGCVGWLKRSYKRWNVSRCYHKSRENLLGVRYATLWGGELVILLMSGQYAPRVEFKCHINKRGFNLCNIKIMNNEIFFLWENRRKEMTLGGGKEGSKEKLFLCRLFDFGLMYVEVSSYQIFL